MFTELWSPFIAILNPSLFFIKDLDNDIKIFMELWSPFMLIQNLSLFFIKDFESFMNYHEYS